MGLLYYAGHGLQFEGQNFIVPVDATVRAPSDIPYVCYPIDKILSRMEISNSRMNIIILDACRNNPFPRFTRGGNDKGLAQVKAAKGSYIAFATAPGSVASDGGGRNGLYTQELIRALKVPKLSIEQVLKLVRQNVSDLSKGQQNTWDNSNYCGRVLF